MMINPVLLRLRIPPLYSIHQKYLSISPNAKSQADFEVIYKLPFIRHFRFIARLKTYQTGVMILSLPPLSYLYKIDVINSSSLVNGVVAAGSAVFVLSILSYAFSKVIGEMQYCKSSELVQISHLSFLGNKKTIKVSVEEVVPFADLDQHTGRLSALQRLELINGRSFYYSLKYGKATELNTLKHILALS